MQYSVLQQTHKEYTPDLWEELTELFQGGWCVLQNAEKYLPRVTGERTENYKQRITTAAYIGYFGPIVRMMVAQLFGQELAISPAADSDDDDTAGDDPADTPEADDFYREFAKDVDGKDRTFPELCKEIVRTALVCRRAYLMYDTEAVDPAAVKNRADEEKAGALQFRAYCLDPGCFRDWETDDEGEYTLAVIKRVFNRRKSLDSDRSKSYEEFKCWERDPDTGDVSWRLFRTRPYGADDPILDTEEIPEVEKGTTSFPHIPIIPFELPEELWIGNQVAPLNREHFRRRSELIGAERQSLFEIPVYKLGSEIETMLGTVPSEKQQDSNRAKNPREALIARGFACIGSEDSLEFVGPTGAAYSIADTQIKELVDEIYRVVSMMAQSISSTSTALHRSGDSKEADASALTIILRELGNLVRKFAVRVYTDIADARGDDVVWQAHGLENYDNEIRQDLIAEALQIDMVAIPSPTFKRHYKTSLAYKLVPELDPATKEQVRREIIQGVQAEEDIRVSQQENEKEIADAGPTPEELGKAPPGAPAGRPAAAGKSKSKSKTPGKKKAKPGGQK